MRPNAPTTTHLIFVRHGQSLANRDGAEVGPDTGLTELGWRQAQLTADWLAANYQPDALVSSGLVRAVQTAEVIGQRLGLAAQIIPELAETTRSYWEELPVIPPEAPLALWDAPWRPTPQNAPIYAAFQAQLRTAMATLLARYTGKMVIAVAHGGSIGTIVRSLFGGHQMPIFTENGGITHLALQEGHWRLLFHNSQEHLAGLSVAEPAVHEVAADQPPPWPDGRQLQAVIEQYQRAAPATPLEPIGAGERELRALVALAAPTPDARLLDVATGAGAVALAFAPHVASVVGVDISPAMLERAERGRLARRLEHVRFRWAEACALPFSARSFDILTCRDLLHYLPDLEDVLAQFRRALAANGKLVIDELVGSDDPVRRATQEAIEIRRDPAFVRLYWTKEIERLVMAAGFRVVSAETYESARELGEWLALAAADDSTQAAVRAMLEAGLETDGAGLGVRRARDGTLTFTQRRLRLLAMVAGDRA
jgi:broad specificity phosphatase PhoE/ubiquinone/menaquinone biosynthesis C-methylase UbiE